MFEMGIAESGSTSSSGNGTTTPAMIRDMIDASPRAAWLVSRVTPLLVAAALIGGFGLAAPAAAQVSDQPPAVRFTP